MRRRWGWWISEESLSAFQALGSVLSRRNMMITSTAITSSPASNSVVSNKTCAIGTFPTLTTKPLPAGRATAPTTLHNPHATSKGSALAPETTQPRLPLQNRQQKRAGGLEIGAQDFTSGIAGSTSRTSVVYPHLRPVLAIRHQAPPPHLAPPACKRQEPRCRSCMPPTHK